MPFVIRGVSCLFIQISRYTDPVFELGACDTGV